MTTGASDLFQPTAGEEVVRVGPLRALRWLPTDLRAPSRFLLIHGLWGGAHMWRRMGPYLAAHGFATYAVWLRHHHPGADHRSLHGVGVRDLAADVIEAAREIGGPILVGHSVGGLVAQVAAAGWEAPGLIIMSSTGPLGVLSLHRGWETVPALLKFAGHPLRSEPYQPDPAYMRRMFFNRLQADEAAALSEQLVPEPRRFVRQVAFWPPHVPRSAIRCPVLVASGSEDLGVIPWVARRLGARYRVLPMIYPGRAHMLQLEPAWEDVGNDLMRWADRFVA